jgi:hypothetical protein
MSIENWSSISYLYQWPESERLKRALAENTTPHVYTMPSLKSDQQLNDEVAEAIEKLQGRPFKRDTPSLDKNGLKMLIVSKEMLLIKRRCISETRPSKSCIQSNHNTSNNPDRQ